MSRDGAPDFATLELTLACGHTHRRRVYFYKYRRGRYKSLHIGKQYQCDRCQRIAFEQEYGDLWQRLEDAMVRAQGLASPPKVDKMDNADWRQGF